MLTAEDYENINTQDPQIADKEVVTVEIKAPFKFMEDSNGNDMVIVKYALVEPANSNMTNDFGEPLQVSAGVWVDQLFWFGGDYVDDTKRKWKKLLETLEGGKLNGSEALAAQGKDYTGTVVKAKVSTKVNKKTQEEEHKIAFVMSVVEE